MTHPWEQAPTGPSADLTDRLAALLPLIETERLVLRAPRIGDFEAYAGIYMSPRWFGHGTEDREEAWLDFCQMVAGWLLRGTGVLSVERRTDGELLGFIPLNHEFGDPDLELGWMLTEAAEGQGCATEAARAVRDFAGRQGLRDLVSYIAPDNARSAAVAERLGARRDRAAEAAYGEPILVYRHPGPEDQR